MIQDRAQQCLYAGQKIALQKAEQALQNAMAEASKNKGEKLAVLYSNFSSPTFLSLINDLKVNYPKALIVEQDNTYAENRRSGLHSIVNKSADVLYNFENANVILALDSDFMGLELDSVKNARQFSEKDVLLT